MDSTVILIWSDDLDSVVRESAYMLAKGASKDVDHSRDRSEAPQTARGLSS